MEPYPHRRRGQLRRAGGLGRVATGRLVDRPLRYAPGIGAQRLCPRACHHLLVWATIPITFYLAYGVGRVIFASPVKIGSSVVVSRWFIRMRGRAIGTLFMSYSIGMIAFPLIASAVIAGRGWQDASMLLGLLVWAIALLPVVLLMAERPEDVGLRPDGDPERPAVSTGGAPAAEEPAWALKEAMRTPSLWILATATGSLLLAQAGVNTHLAAPARPGPEYGLSRGRTQPERSVPGARKHLLGMDRGTVPGQARDGLGGGLHRRDGGTVHHRRLHGRSLGLLRSLRLRCGRDPGGPAGSLRQFLRAAVLGRNPGGNRTLYHLGPSHRSASLGGGLRSDRQLPYRLHRVRLVGGVHGSPGALRQAAATSGTCR